PPCARSSSRADEKELQQVSELGSALTYRGGHERVGLAFSRRLLSPRFRASSSDSRSKKSACAHVPCAAARKRKPGDDMNFPILAPHCALARALAFLMLAAVTAFALAQQRPDSGKVLKKATRQPLRLPPPEEPVLPKPPEPKPALPTSPQLRVTVQKFTFTGNTLYSDAQLAQVVEEFIGKNLDFEGLNDAATKIRAYYRSRGYFLAQA